MANMTRMIERFITILRARVILIVFSRVKNEVAGLVKKEIPKNQRPKIIKLKTKIIGRVCFISDLLGKKELEMVKNK